jgi:hypothetical protein
MLCCAMPCGAVLQVGPISKALYTMDYSIVNDFLNPSPHCVLPFCAALRCADWHLQAGPISEALQAMVTAG